MSEMALKGLLVRVTWIPSCDTKGMVVGSKLWYVKYEQQNSLGSSAFSLNDSGVTQVHNTGMKN